MSDWDFLWGLKGEELEDVMSCGMTAFDIAYVDEEQRRAETKKAWQILKGLRDNGQISREEFKARKNAIFTDLMY